MKVFDCFKLFNELELMELRLETLYDYVDYFVIAEANKTHTGHPKPFYFEENKERFAKYLDKIRYVKVEDLPTYDQNPNRNPTSIDWAPENEQRRALARGYEGVAVSGDRIFVSDLDEIWDPARLKEATETNDRVVFSQAMFYYFTNTRFGSKGNGHNWNGTVVASYGTFKDCQELRDQRGMVRQIRGDAGWHISYAGKPDHILSKVQNIAESNLMLGRMGDEGKIKQKLATLTDPLERMTLTVDNFYQPACISWFHQKFPHFKYGA